MNAETSQSKLNFLFRSTNLHGFKLLADESSVTWKKGFTRIFWTVAFALSFFYMSKMLGNVFRKAGQSTAIMPDTSYLHWTNAFPAFSLCMNKGSSTAAIKEFVQANLNQSMWKNYNMNHYRAMHSSLFLNTKDPTEGITLSDCSMLNESCGIDIEYAKKVLVPQDCSKIIEKLVFMGKKINCTDHFKYYETEYGSCFIANSIYSSSNLRDFNLDFSELPLRYKNTDNVNRTMEIYYRENKFLIYKFSIHSPEEMPDHQNTFTGVRVPGLLYYVALKTVEYVNQEEVPFESQESRKCRFPWERFNNFSLPYCRSNCFFLQRVERELAECGCTMPAGLNVSIGVTKCSIKEIECIAVALHKYKISIDDKEFALKANEKCLTPTCTYMEVTRIGEFEEPIKGLEKGIGLIRVEIMNKPTLRYVRRVQFTKLDMIVQVGGIVGLFFGASFLSILEIFYIIFQMLCMKRRVR